MMNMNAPAQQANNKRVNKVVLACVGSGIFLFLVLSTLWGYQVYKHRGYHAKHLRRLDKEANDLSDETIKIRGEVDLDISIDDSTKLINLEILTSAEDWDTAIRTALSAWGDLVEANRRAPETVKSGNEKVDIGRKKGYARSIIGIMREKSVEGIERRKALSSQMQKIYADAHSRRVRLSKKKKKSRAPSSSRSGQRSHHTKTIRPSIASIQSDSFETAYHSDRRSDRRSSSPSRAISDVNMRSSSRGGLRIYV